MKPTFLILFLSCSVALAGPWADFLQGRRQVDPGRRRWSLCVQQSLLAPADLLADDDYQKLATGGDWGIEALSTAQAQDLQTTLGARWALLTPAGEVAGSGAGRPGGKALLELIHGTGAKTRWERRQAFLEAHPDQGEARLEALGQDLRLLRAKVSSLDQQGKVKVPLWHPEPGSVPGDDRIALAGADGDARAEELYGGVAATLRQLSGVPNWTDAAQEVATRLGSWQLGQAASLRRLFTELAPELEALAAGDPEDAGLVRLWMEVLDGAGRFPESLSGRITPVPGGLWPTPQILASLVEPYRRRRDWDGLQKLLADLAPDGPPAPLTKQGWQDYCRLQAALAAQRGVALASAGAWDQARSELEEAARWGGSHPAQLGALRRSALDPGADGLAWRRLLSQLSNRAPAPPPMPPAPPPLRLVLMGRPPWLLGWTTLRDAPELALWAPAELRWEIATAADQAQGRSRFGWDAQPRWVLFRGEHPLASGETLPEARALAAVLAGQASPLLERMARVLAGHPDHVATRRARFQLLQLRMPDRRLEPLMAEDAARALLELPFAPGEAWKPDETLWGEAAQRVLPELETRLRSWPADTDLWKAWISWARFHPGHPSILVLAEGLPYWDPGNDWRTGLPYPVLRAVAGELRRQGRFLELKDWFQTVWDALDHRPLKDLRPWEKHWLGDRRAEEETAVFQPLRDALRALGLHEQQLELERSFGAMMGKDVARSR